MTTTVLSVSRVGKRYVTYRSNFQRFATWFGLTATPTSEYWANHNISFDVQSGEALALIGQNGAGKSTLLKMITGTIRPTTGSIAVTGQVSAILELGLGFNPEFTGRQNVYQAGGLMGYSHSELSGMMQDIEKFAEIGDFFDKPIRMYSSGMQARLAFALATAKRAEVLIVDEVLSVGDAYFQAKCYERISNFRKAGTSLILVTHSMSDVVKHCDRAILINDGKIAFDGDPAQATNLYYETTLGVPKVHPSAELSVENNDKMAVPEHDLFHTRPLYRKEEHRWGQGGALITDYKVMSKGLEFPPVVTSGSDIIFSFAAKFDGNYENVVPGFLVKTHDGIFIYGTNSLLAASNKEKISVKSGDKRIFQFSMKCALNAGHYLISFGLSHGTKENLIPMDRRYDSVLLTVEHHDGFWGMCDLGAKFEAIN